MRRRPVFDDIALREEFRRRLQPAGITIPESKLNLRPSFPVDVLRDPAALTAVKSALEWFAVICVRAGPAEAEPAPNWGKSSASHRKTGARIF